MCGIAGILSDASPDLDRIEAMTAAIRHRGPDDTGLWRGHGIALGHRRLSIIDLSEGGHQPMVSADGRHALVFNGEIYNFREIRLDLESQGCRFVSRSDSEVLLQAYRTYGSSCVSRLRGMFSFAVWDATSSKLFMARDRLGKKPLYYAKLGRRFAFASEIKALLQLDWVRKDLDPAALSAYFGLQYIPGPATIFRSVRKLPPACIAHVARADDSAPRIEPYWTPPPSNPAALAARGAEEKLDRLLLDSVRMRLISDVPVGVLLSGGLDSSLVAGMAARLCRGRLQTFSVRFKDADLDESRHARAVASLIGSEHEELEGDAPEPGRFLRVARHLDEPLADPACLPTFDIAECASRRVKVVLSGEGSDELFGGYPHYLLEQRSRALWTCPPAVRSALLRAAAGILSAAGKRRAAARLRFVREEDADLGVNRWTTVFSPSTLLPLLSPGAAGLLATHDPYARIRGARTASSGSGRVEEGLGTDLRVWLPDDLLMKVDKMTMAHGLEARCPFLDHELVDFIARLPLRWKIRGSQTKVLLKQVAARYLPSSIVHRGKHGFETPILSWLRGPLRELGDELFSPRTLSRHSMLSVQASQDLWKRVQSQPEEVHPRHAWTLFSLLAWSHAFDLPLAVADP